MVLFHCIFARAIELRPSCPRRRHPRRPPARQTRTLSFAPPTHPARMAGAHAFERLDVAASRERAALVAHVQGKCETVEAGGAAKLNPKRENSFEEIRKPEGKALPDTELVGAHLLATRRHCGPETQENQQDQPLYRRTNQLHPSPESYQFISLQAVICVKVLQLYKYSIICLKTSSYPPFR